LLRDDLDPARRHAVFYVAASLNIIASVLALAALNLCG
jgi:hypothetical protein